MPFARDATVPMVAVVEDIPPLKPREEEQFRSTLTAWAALFTFAAGHFGTAYSRTGASRLREELSIRPGRDEGSGRGDIEMLAAVFGLSIKVEATPVRQLSHAHLPIIIEMQDGTVALVDRLLEQRKVRLVRDGDGSDWGVAMLDDLAKQVRTVISPRPHTNPPDARIDDYIRPNKKNWLRRLVLRDLRPYGYVMLASVVANALTLTGVLFSMQVYDRVIPAESMPTLHVLFLGVAIAILFDFLLRRLRAQIIDVVGKQADARLSDVVFGHALRVTNKARPKSTGTFIAQLRDLEQVRETLTSTTIAAIADLPFFLLFLGVFWFIGGPLVAIPVVALIILVTPGVLAQGALRNSAGQAMREASLRNATLVETIQGIEDVKALQAEDRFQQKWNYLTTMTAAAQLRTRNLNGSLTAWSHSLQMSVYAVTIFIGAPMVIAGDMTTGALVACSILGSRMMSPMAQLAHVLTRLQQAKLGFQSLSRIISMPVDHPDAETRISVGTLEGRYHVETATFHHDEDSPLPALAVKKLDIAAGDRIAVLGRNGAGKSTLLHALSGMLQPTDGQVLLDGLTLDQIDPADVRSRVGLLTQQSRLFHGTIRENLMLGAPNASEAEIIAVLSMVGALEFVSKLPRGLEHPILEGGRGLSGGQQQALLLARLLIRSPKVLLLDEPTAAMDEATEREFIVNFRKWSAGRTVIIATHRMRVLDLVNRIVVLEGGQIALDDRKEKALERLRGIRAEASPAAAANAGGGLSVRELQQKAGATISESPA